MDSLQWGYLIEAIGWASTVLFVTSFLVRNRSVLHLLGFFACILKLIYSYEHAVWPLFVNWVILLFVQAYQYFAYRRDD
jgi:hypothetical protein